MRADTVQIEKRGNIGGDVARMGIDDSNLAHIMSILTNMYSDTELAVLREYSTNAWDAHVEARNTGTPIEVTTPTSLDPYLRIRDYGTGLSVEDVHSMYSRYGASSKRDTNEQNGMLGIGSKSGLSYADQFTLTSVKNGTKLTCVVSRDEDGGGSMTIPDTRATDEPNGTTVTIPVQRSNAFAMKAEDFFQYWPSEHVLVNGKHPAHFTERGDNIEIAPNVWYSRNVDKSVIVMGGVAYPHDFRDTIVGFNTGCLVAFVPIGDVSFAPSREALNYTRRTNETIERIGEAYRAGVQNAIQREADKAEHHFDALKIVLEWEQLLPGAPKGVTYTFKGDSLPDGYEAPAGTLRIHSLRDRPYWRRGSTYADEQKGVPAMSFPDTVWIANFAPAKFDKLHKRKIERTLAERDLLVQTQRTDASGNIVEEIVSNPFRFYALLAGDAPVSRFIDTQKVLDWTEVRKVKLSPVTTDQYGRKRRLTGSYDGIIDGEQVREVPAAHENLQPKGGRKVLWLHGSRWDGDLWTNACQVAFGTYTIVTLPENRIAKFCRDFPHAEKLIEALDAALDAFIASFTPEQQAALAIYEYRSNSYGGPSAWTTLRSLDASRIDDPELTTAIQTATVDVKPIADQRAKYRRPYNQVVTKWTNPLNKYPLFNAAQAKHDHTYIYLNAAYKAQKESA